MTYSMEEFCANACDILKQSRSTESLEAIAGKLEQLLADEDAVESLFGGESVPPRRILHHDEETGFYFLAHIHPEGRRSPPHDHGESWAVYGTAKGCTKMCEWRRTEAADGSSSLEPVKRYELTPGMAKAYGSHVIHSTSFDDTAWVIRVTGTDLLTIPVYRYDKTRDTIVDTGLST